MTTDAGTRPFSRPLAEGVNAAALAARLPAGSRVLGDGAQRAHAIAGLGSAPAGSLAFCDRADPDVLAASDASIVIVPATLRAPARDAQTLIAVADLRSAFIDLVEWLLPGSARPPAPARGVHAQANVDATAQVSPQASLGANVAVGARSRIEPGAVVYGDTTIGDDCTIGPNSVVGWVGLGYHDGDDGRRRFFPHLGGVRIGPRVDIGANATVCRGMLSHTLIGADAKLGSGVYVSHGVDIGERAWLSAGTLVAGHARVGVGALLGIGAVVVDNVSLDDGVVVAGGGVATRDAPRDARLVGVPAVPVARMRRFGPTPRE